jgi:hypothetical protein
MARSAFLLLVGALALTLQIANAHVVRLSTIPQNYWGTWAASADACPDTQKALVLSAKTYVTSASSCAVDYLSETPSEHGSVYSARLQCAKAAGGQKKSILNLIIRPDNANQISVGPGFSSLTAYQRCPSGESKP